MPRTCLACGKTGHRLDSCKSKAAVEIRRLRSILEKTRHKVGARNNPGRKNRKSGYTKEKARKAYAKNMSGRLTVKNTKKGQQSDMVWISSKLEEAEWKPLVGIWDIAPTWLLTSTDSIFGMRMQKLRASGWDRQVKGGHCVCAVWHAQM